MQSVGPSRPAINGTKTTKGGEVKTRSARSDFRPEWSNKKSRGWFAAAMIAVTTLFANNLINHAMAAGEANACQQTALAALDGCRTVAQSDYEVALGKCVNISDPAARVNCQRQAATDLSDALDTCQGGLNVRQVACQKLGPARYDPVIDPANFVSRIDNPYFPLVPGTTFIYEDHFAGSVMRDEFAVTHNTKVLDGVTCVEVHDSVFTDGALTEDTLDWFAQDRDGNVWYFGENTHELENGLITTIAGTFMAGVNGDKPGIIMKAHPAVGDFYRQEFSLANAEDYGETLSLNASVTVPYGSFEHCLRSQETTPLEPDLLEDKFYALGVGNILTVDAITGERTELIRVVSH
jgi:hypothetical protein